MILTCWEKDKGMWKGKVSGHRKIGIPKLRWSDVIRTDVKEKVSKFIFSNTTENNTFINNMNVKNTKTK